MEPSFPFLRLSPKQLQREARAMVRRAMIFFLTLCCLLLGWAALAMGEKLDGLESGAPSPQAGYFWEGEAPCFSW